MRNFIAMIGLVPALGLAQWGQFRGPNGAGVDDSLRYPAEFSAAKNVIWKKSVPYGQSSPVVAGNRLYLTAATPEGLVTIALDARTGAEVWKRELGRARTHKIFAANDAASPTPAADENGVVVFFPDFGLAAYTPDGKDAWTMPLGPFQNFYGMASSPILAGDLVVLLCDQQKGSFLLALDRKSGRQRWKTDRPLAALGWATPMVFRPSQGEPQLIVLGSQRLDSYYLATGEPRWWTPVASMGSMGSPVASGDTLFVATTGTNEPWMPVFATVLATYDKDKDGRLSFGEFRGDKDLGEHFGWLDNDSDGFITAPEWDTARGMASGDYGVAAIRPGQAKGKLDPAAVRWRFKKNLPYVPAPLLYRDVYYMVRDGGIVTSLDPATGQVLKQGRGSGALGEYYASPVAADGKVFLASGEGKITVLKAAGAWELLGMNDLGEEIHATPALSGGRIYVRTRGSLYCFGTQR